VWHIVRHFCLFSGLVVVLYGRGIWCGDRQRQRFRRWPLVPRDVCLPRVELRLGGAPF
jgi:hypothetical protein